MDETTFTVHDRIFRDDGLVPNNSKLPLLIYPAAVAVTIARPEQAFLGLFASNGWGGGWIDSIYPFQHYHSNAHEVLGIAQGTASVQFGGPNGPVMGVRAGDVVIIPAGGGHCLKEQSDDLSVVGAYPAGQHDVDLMRATADDRARAMPRIASVPLPIADPVGGGNGPLLRFWR